MNLFYSTQINANSIILDEDESKHCTKVLRKTIGDKIHVIDGKGNLFLSEITEITKKNCYCSIIETHSKYGNHNYTLRMCVAPTKNIDRFEYFVEKAVEIGINEIIPIVCENSERKILKLERIERIILSAMKQSYKASMPILHELTEIKTVLNTKFDGISCIAHCEESQKQLLKNLPITSQPTTILIGPEGDFSIPEITLALRNNWLPISLGESRLRTETAAIAAVHSVHFMNM